MRSKRDRKPARARLQRAAAGTVALAALVGAIAALLSPPSTAAAAAKEKTVAPPAALTAAALARSALFDLPTETWFDPPEVPPPGDHRVPLTVRYGDNTVRLADGKLQGVRLRSYDGGLVGPTFRLHPGDRLGVDLINQLPKEHEMPCQDEATAPTGMNMEGMGLNTTNLHTHGLHISPSDPSDNVLREVRPGCTHKYLFPILPAGNPPGEPAMAHYPGTFWYHAHVHGSTAVQLASGMAGALIVMGDIDEIPEIKAARERIFVFQQLAFGKDGQVRALGDLFCNWSGPGEDCGADAPPKKHT
ncbi:MAG TPA: multicopper oxidase domain-containing protein, partial [Thermoanaerobaculia bacterium]